jgi:hypothetical protein
MLYLPQNKKAEDIYSLQQKESAILSILAAIIHSLKPSSSVVMKLILDSYSVNYLNKS